MHPPAHSDAGDVSSPRSSRAYSFSSERPTVAGSVTFQMPSTVRPAPAYIAASVASQTVTDHHKQHREPPYDSDKGDSVDHLVNALFSEQALSLLNAFLDHLLFAFLSTARSPSLATIRPAITEVLKPRLAREAMSTADEELQGLLAGEDDEEFPTDGKAGNVWNVEKVWKRTRLRIMVYTRLGEFEDEDEERYVQQERGLSMDKGDDEAGLVSWASAIFLTSVVEYVAEQTLLVSGQAAFARMAAKVKKVAQTSPDDQDQPLERIIVEEFDVEKLALNSALGRLWRTWRKRVRTPIKPLSPTFSGPRYMSSFTSLHRRRVSHDTVDEYGAVSEMPEHKPTETEIAANIPLPIGDNDVEEIEVPGLARSYDEAESSGTETPIARPRRSSTFVLAPAETFRRRLAKKRPASMPPPETLPFVVPAQSEIDTDELEFETPMERMSDDESYIMDERQEGMSHAEDEDDDDDDDADMVAFTASTGMGFGMGLPLGPASQVKTGGFDPDDDEALVTPTQRGFTGQPHVFTTKRLSIKESGPPGLVRTYSARRPTSHDRTSSATTVLEPAALIKESHVADDMDDSDAIGVAQTSNVAIPATPSPPLEAAFRDQRIGHTTQPALGGYVEVLPRNSASTSTPIRRTPSPESAVSLPESPILPQSIRYRDSYMVQQREVQGKDTSSSQSSYSDTTSRSEVPRTEDVRKVASGSDPFRNDVSQEDLTISKTRSYALGTRPHQTDSPEKQTNNRRRGGSLRGSISIGSPLRNNSSRGVPSTETPPRSSPNLSRSRTSSDAVERSTLKRLSSSSSTGRSVSTSILHSAHNSDVSIGGRPRGLSARMSVEDREREFDSLVKGQDTVKFTLTPDTVRDDESPVMQHNVDPLHEQETEADEEAANPPSSETATVTVYPHVNADKDNSFGSQPLPTRTPSRNSGTTASTTRSANRSMLARPLAREPRIQSESMRDFADFIRSTGPSVSEDRPVKPFVSLSGANNKSANGSTPSLGGLTRKSSTKQTPSHSHSSSGAEEKPSTKHRVHMEPRSPAGPRSGNDDLIDFIRQGPPGSGDGQHRIPRNVAPFRSTVDSDQFERMLDDNSNVESNYGSQVSTASKQSTHTANSKTNLLPAANVVQPAYSSTPPNLSGNFSNPEPQIQRTRRRVKDPYAIDLTDDEDDDLLTALPKPAKREESLMDFLNSMEPPSSNEQPKPLLSGAALAAARARSAKNAASSPSTSVLPSGIVAGNGVSNRPGNSQGAPILPISSPAGPPRHGPQIQARQAGARDARTVGRSATNDLADFLRNSGPPEPIAPRAPIQKEENKRKFWRRKVSEAA